MPPLTPSSFSAMEAIIGRLEGDDLGKKDHAGVEALINRDGRQIFLQGHFDLHALREEREPMVGADGEERRHQWTCDRAMLVRRCWAYPPRSRSAAWLTAFA